jgi:triphosphoribosyl-dephospho-CoA synthase
MKPLHQKGSPPVERCLACEADIESVPGSRVWLRRTSREAEKTLIKPTVTAQCTLLGVLAKQALIAEAELTPKPSLVDRRGSGAHTDLSLSLMKRSAIAIEPFISRMAFQATFEQPSARLRTKLAGTGRAAESAMLRVTNGSNTHKGAIWTLGLLAAAAAGRDELPLIRDCHAASQFNLDAVSIARAAALIASFEDSNSVNDLTHGQIVAQKYGVTGARGEAVSGFPHILEIGLPMLRARRRDQAPESIARLDTLLSIMAQLDDTCLLYRGGEPGLQAAKQGAATVLDAGGAGSSPGQKVLFALDKELLELGVSPGGSADLLAGTLFLDAIEHRQTKIASFGIETIFTDEQELIPTVNRGRRLQYGTIRI